MSGKKRLRALVVCALTAAVLSVPVSPVRAAVLLSATTAQVAEVLNPQTGAVTGRFATGTYPHQND